MERQAETLLLTFIPSVFLYETEIEKVTEMILRHFKQVLGSFFVIMSPNYR